MNNRTLIRMLVGVAVLSLIARTLAVASADVPERNSGDFDRAIQAGGRLRTFHVHVPESSSTTDVMPVVIVLHGGGGNGQSIERSTGFSDLADERGFVAAYPDGTGRRPHRSTWNAHNCCGYAYDEQVDDVAFISSMIDQLIADFNVDPTRIYVTGFSNGAMMTFRIACELSDKIAAAAPNAGALNTDDCAPGEPLPMLIINGDQDRNVPMAGGTSPNVGVPIEDVRVDRPTSHAVDIWVAADACDSTAMVEDTGAATTTTYDRCNGGAVVEQIVIHGWGHHWPRLEDDAPIEASKVIWDFVSQFSKPAA
jgi:polyhydroxybutyrate depolymerase